MRLFLRVSLGFAILLFSASGALSKTTDTKQFEPAPNLEQQKTQLLRSLSANQGRRESEGLNGLELQNQISLSRALFALDSALAKPLAADGQLLEAGVCLDVPCRSTVLREFLSGNREDYLDASAPRSIGQVGNERFYTTRWLAPSWEGPDTGFESVEAYIVLIHNTQSGDYQLREVSTRIALRSTPLRRGARWAAGLARGEPPRMIQYRDFDRGPRDRVRQSLRFSVDSDDPVSVFVKVIRNASFSASRASANESLRYTDLSKALGPEQQPGERRPVLVSEVPFASKSLAKCVSDQYLDSTPLREVKEALNNSVFFINLSEKGNWIAKKPSD